jgi:hypothetical protein
MKNKLVKQAWIQKTQRIKRQKYPKGRTKHDHLYRPLFCDIDQFEVLNSIINTAGGGTYFFRPKLNTDLH